MSYLYALIGIIICGFGIYIFNKLDEKAKSKGKWINPLYGPPYTLWQIPMYVCFVALLICLLPFLELLF
jgi:hypothetical protein